MIMFRISGVLTILLTRRTKDNTVNKNRATDSVRIKEAIRFSIAYKKAGSKKKVIAITNRLPPVSSPLFTTEIMRRFDAIIKLEQVIKKDFLFIYDTSNNIAYNLAKVRLDKDKPYLLASCKLKHCFCIHEECFFYFLPVRIPYACTPSSNTIPLDIMLSSSSIFSPENVIFQH